MFKNVDEIKAAVDAGKKVCWKMPYYIVKKTKFDYVIFSTSSHSSIGLTQSDDKTLNGKLSDFYIEKN